MRISDWSSDVCSSDLGSGLIPPGTGVLLNDEMDDFALKPGTPNAFGVMGYDANAPEPGKRMLSSMTPTFMESKDKVTVLGTPGGTRIDRKSTRLNSSH